VHGSSLHKSFAHNYTIFIWKNVKICNLFLNHYSRNSFSAFWWDWQNSLFFILILSIYRRRPNEILNIIKFYQSYKSAVTRVWSRMTHKLTKSYVFWFLRRHFVLLQNNDNKFFKATLSSVYFWIVSIIIYIT